MIFAIRADASIQIGSGHIIRCLSIADQLKAQGHQCFFISRNHDGNLVDFVTQRGYQTFILENDQENTELLLNTEYQKWLGVSEVYDAEQTVSLITAQYQKIDWVIVDHYGLSTKWETSLKKIAKHILVIDDLANREHDADIILDCGMFHVERDYTLLNKFKAKILVGPKYALLRPEFAEYRKKVKTNQTAFTTPLKLLINLGGVDKDNLTTQILNIIENTVCPYEVELTIIMGLNAPWKSTVIERAKQLKHSTQVLVNVSNMAELMVNHDLAIGAAGSTAWERCCLGLPTIMICMADNQKMIAKGLHDLGVTISLDQTEIKTKLSIVLQKIKPAQLREMQRKSMQITEGLGVNLLINEILRKSL
ncbi:MULTISPECIES: UDP-2,4-diacetamido-2,4,6-trideoxy-beta-L-altropyranose hydrolase [unclassified Acinetobacter]|uniref:UDP-2,4-diacetamido-2,4, 6-trideoxy-beta-L-altropyranose hydrolase n=1 Tax=unclassified Acinetobacter TaxID=196816 RepID=UPI0015D1BE71